MASFGANIDATSEADGGTLTVTRGGAFSKSLYVGTDIRLPTGNLYLGATAITPQTARALGGTPGVSSAGFFMSPDANNDLSGVRRLTTAQITLGNTTNSQIPLEIGYTPFLMTQAFAFNSSSGGRGSIAANPTGAIYNYSIRALGRILCATSIDVMSDRRKKTNVEELSEEYCAEFVNKTTPVSFHWAEGDQNKAYGCIAQDLIRAGYSDLVNLAEDESVMEEIDDDRFVSPQCAKFTVSYEHIIPILAKNQRMLMRENAELRAKLDAVLNMIASSL